MVDNLTHTQLSFPVPVAASKTFPLRVLLSWIMGTESRLISFSDGGGEPSTHPFHPFLTATLFLRGGLDDDDDEAVGSYFSSSSSSSPSSSSSSGVSGLLDDVRDVPTELVGAGVDVEVDAREGGDERGGGVTETDRCIVAMWMAGRARQKDDADAEAAFLVGELEVDANNWGVEDIISDLTSTAASGSSLCLALAAATSLLLSRSRSLFSFALFLLVS